MNSAQWKSDFMQVYVIRHGLSQANADGVIQGFADSPLAVAGKEQAGLLGRYLKRENVVPEIIYCSPLLRAFETAGQIAGAYDPSPPIHKVDGLKEIDVGKLSGMSLEDAYRSNPTGWTPDVNKWLDFSAFGGESCDDFFERVGGAVREIVSGWDDLLADRTIFFVAHAGSMRPLLKYLLDADGDFMFFTFGNCCHVRVEYREVRGSVRRALSDLVRIEKVAQIMGLENPCADTEDTVGSKIG